jgi:aminoglycoside phosphotransferase (APT) family kinase protein
MTVAAPTEATARADVIERLRTAMNDERMRSLLAEHWDVLEYAVQVDAPEGKTTVPLFAELVRGNVLERHEEAVTSLRKARRGQLKDESTVEGVCALPDLGLIVRLAGLDERIPALRFVHRPRQIRPLLEPFLATPGTKLKHVWPELLGHRLGKRAAVRMRYELKNKETKERITGTVFVKMFKRRSDRGRELGETHTALAELGLAGDAPVRVPSLIAYLPEWEMLVTENVPGVSLADLEGENFAAGVRMAGSAIARLHTCDLVPERTHTVADEIDLLEGWVRLVGEVEHLPAPVRDRTVAAFERVRGELGSVAGAPTALVHRDFYEKQVIIDEDRTVLIDFDTLCRADPAIDLGNFIAHIRLARAKGISVSAGLEDSFLSAYGGGSVDDDLTARVRIYTQATLLRLVCLYSFWPRWRGVPERLAEELS